MGPFLVMLALAVQVLGSAGLCAVADGACRGACGPGPASGECGPMSPCGGRDESSGCGVAVQSACGEVPATVAADPAEPAPPCEGCTPCPLDEPFQAPAGSGHELAAAALLSDPVPAASRPLRVPATARAPRAPIDPGRLRPSICVWVI